MPNLEEDVPDENGHPALAEFSLDAVLHALSDPNRRRVVAELLSLEEGAERTCASFGLPVTKSSLTYHFRILRESGLIWDVDHGNRKSVSIRKGDMNDRFPGLLELITNEGMR